MDCLVDTAPEMDGKEQMLPLTLACFSSFSFLCLNDMGNIYTQEDIKLLKAQMCFAFLQSSFKGMDVNNTLENKERAQVLTLICLKHQNVMFGSLIQIFPFDLNLIHVSIYKLSLMKLVKIPMKPIQSKTLHDHSRQMEKK